MAFKLSSRSEQRLIGVHPDLIRVVRRAIEISRVDFGVLEGTRTAERQRELLAEGKSTTARSLHLIQPDGYSHAVDLFVLVGGEISWQHKHFRYAVQAMFTAAIELGVQIEAGALWRDFQDSPHFQLNQQYR